MDTESNGQDAGEVLADQRSVGIFIKTCRKDLAWLDYCLRSIDKFGTGFAEMVIMADDDCRDSDVLKNRIAHYCPVPANGYLYQQLCKLNADRLLKSDLILFVDSDCVFNRPFTPASFVSGGKPILLKERWTRFDAEHPVHCWKAITERHTSFRVDFEYMRRMPLIHDRQVLEFIRHAQPWLGAALLNRSDREFSEFNVMGAYADTVMPDKYSIVEVGVDPVPAAVCEQFWSWGGITEDIQFRVEALLA